MVIRLEERQSVTPTDFEPPKQQPDANFILLHKAIKGAEQYQENQNNQTSKASPHYLNRFLKKFPLKNTIWPNQPSVFPLSAKDQSWGLRLQPDYKGRNGRCLPSLCSRSPCFSWRSIPPQHLFQPSPLHADCWQAAGLPRTAPVALTGRSHQEMASHKLTLASRACLPCCPRKRSSF